MVNGAGLAMATMDIIKLYGQEPANFLDVGGGASKEQVAAAFKLILSDKKVKGNFNKYFWRNNALRYSCPRSCRSSKRNQYKIPLVVRLAGTNFEEGKKILEKSGLKNFISI